MTATGASVPQHALWVDFMPEDIELFHRGLGDFHQFGVEPKGKSGVVADPFHARASECAGKLCVPAAVEREDCPWRDDPLRAEPWELIVPPAVRTVHRDVVDPRYQRAAVMVGDENIGRSNRHDIWNPDRARTAKGEPSAALAFETDHVGVSIAVDLNAASEELVADEILIGRGPVTLVVRAPSGSAEIHECLHVIVSNLRPPQHAIIGRGLRQTDGKVGHVYEKAGAA